MLQLQKLDNQVRPSESAPLPGKSVQCHRREKMRVRGPRLRAVFPKVEGGPRRPARDCAAAGAGAAVLP